MTQKALLLVSTNPASAGEVAEYHRWYDEVHIPQIVERIPGFVGATRYAVHEASLTKPDQQYVCVYEIEADDVGAAFAALVQGVQDGTLDSTTTLAREPAPMVLLQKL